MFLDSGKCFGFWEVLWILGSVFGFWDVFLDSGTCFWILGSVLDSGKCFVPTSHRTICKFNQQTMVKSFSVSFLLMWFLADI